MKASEWATGITVVLAGIVLAGWNVSVGRRLTALEQIPKSTPVGQMDTATVSVKGIMLGSADAPITIVEFSDYQCPFCRRFTEETLPVLVNDYITKGVVRLFVRDFPLRSIHPNAAELALAARCAASIDGEKFEAFHLGLFQHGSEDVPSAVLGAAAKAALDPVAITECMEVRQFTTDIEGDEAEALKIGLRGTPAFVIGRSDAHHLSGQIIRGARPTEDFVAAIETLLSPPE